VRKDGKVVWGEVSINIIRDSQGSPLYFLPIIQNITERKRSEEALRESERKFRETVFNLDEGYYSVTLDGVLLEHNQAFSSILGFDQTADLKGKQMPDFWQNLDERNVYLQKFAANGFISNYEVNVRTETGEKITVIISAHLVKDADNLPLRIEGVVLDITERKRFEDELLASEARLRAIIDSTPFPMALVDVQDNNIEYWSRSALDIFGHTAPTTPEWYELAYPDPEYRREVIERWKPFLETARLSGQPVNTGEYRVSCHDGSVRLCELYATFLSDKLIVTFNDITERKRAEELLLLKNIVFDESIAANSIADIDGVITEANDAFLQIWGYSSKDEVVGNPISYFLNDLDEAVAIVNALNVHGEWQGDFTAKKKDGSTFIAHTMATTIQDENGKVTGYQSSVVDITDRKRAEEELQASDALLQAAINIIPVGLWIFDAEGKIVTSSAAAQRIWNGVHYVGIDQLGEYKGWRTDSGKLIEAHEWAGARALEKGETSIEDEVEIECFDGTHKIILDSALPLRKSDGSISGAITVNQDITDRKRAESQREAALEEIRRLNEDLEQRIKDRTAELQVNIDLLEETNLAFVGRELRMIELKERITELEKKEK
jgi:PAS domain S-box-containing protein